ncbi:hypothetical protein D9M71_725780 [compost metagenome]
MGRQYQYMAVGVLDPYSTDQRCTIQLVRPQGKVHEQDVCTDFSKASDEVPATTIDAYYLETCLTLQCIH